MHSTKSFRYHLTWWFLILGWVATYVDAQSRRGQSRRGRRPNKKRSGRAKLQREPFYGWRLILLLLFLCFLPPLASFTYNLYKDPMAPTLWSNSLEFFREKMLGFLAEVNQPRRRRKVE